MAIDHVIPSLREKLDTIDYFTEMGRITEVRGSTVLAKIRAAQIGEMYRLKQPDGAYIGLVEVVGFYDDSAILLPLGKIDGASTQTLAEPYSKTHSVPVSFDLLGRVLDGLGNPMDLHAKPPIEADLKYPAMADPPDPLQRKGVNSIFPSGLRVIDSLLTCGEGQRIGIFAAAGVGKSTLLSSLARNCEADITVLALIGERGREVQEFIDIHLGDDMSKSVVVVATADQPAMQRVRAAYVATAIAEFFRDNGKKVLLLMDSVTRYARALREVGLAAGEPPTRRGYPPSVFAVLPKLLERAGQGTSGSITAFYTVLVEGDDMNEPVADEVRSLVDGHLVLSRKLAESNHYPAIDVLESKSRVMDNIIDNSHKEIAGKTRGIKAKYNDIELLVQMGEYRPGADPEADFAYKMNSKIDEYLKQGLDEKSTYADAMKQLKGIIDVG